MPYKANKSTTRKAKPIVKSAMKTTKTQTKQRKSVGKGTARKAANKLSRIANKNKKALTYK